MKKEEKNERPPVVVVLGHVDHGKSSLLEAVKDLKITEKEAGGITQHIGSYVVLHKGKEITFIDTPGHEAFFAMRSRGTRIADIGILVVAADESIKEQTKEAIEHLVKAKMPFIVAINKIDKKNIDIEKVKQDLSKEEVFVESYGGNIPSVNVSAKEKKGIEDLLEMIILLAEIEELESEKVDFAEGVVIEVERDSKKGVVVTLLVKKGFLKKGDVIATGCSHGKIKIMEDFLGEEVEVAGPSMPVQVTGIKECPSAGEEFFVFQKLDDAKKFVLNKPRKEQELQTEDKKTLNLIIKADVMGSLEAIESSLEKISQKEISIRIIKADVGKVTESDIECSKMSGAEIYCFKTKTDKAVEKIAIRENTKIHNFEIIYELIERVKENAEKLLEDEVIKTEVGKIKILAVFRTQKNRQILGGKALEGEVRKGSNVEIWKEKEKKGEGKLINIKKEERDVEKILENEEFGMLLESKERAEEGDFLVLYKEEKIKKTL
jgi:translation initiation factor IF-2